MKDEKDVAVATQEKTDAVASETEKQKEQEAREEKERAAQREAKEREAAKELHEKIEKNTRILNDRKNELKEDFAVSLDPDSDFRLKSEKYFVNTYFENFEVLLGRMRTTISESVQKEREAKERAAKEREAKEEKAAWIQSFGSDRLKRAFAKDYSCEKQYITERAEAELGSEYQLDYDDEFEYKNRSCPSITALDEQDRIENLKLKNCIVKIVWVTKDRSDSNSDEEYENEEYEAVKVEYLQKYFYKQI
jgi:hypothetical protein